MPNQQKQHGSGREEKCDSRVDVLTQLGHKQNQKHPAMYMYKAIWFSKGLTSDTSEFSVRISSVHCNRVHIRKQ